MSRNYFGTELIKQLADCNATPVFVLEADTGKVIYNNDAAASYIILSGKPFYSSVCSINEPCIHCPVLCEEAFNNLVTIKADENYPCSYADVSFVNYMWEDKLPCVVMIMNLKKDAASQETSPNTADEAVRILIVDDNELNLKVAYGLIYRLYNIQSDITTSGSSAIEMIKNRRYDIIFMDYMMPELDGIETTRIIRKLKTDNVDEDYYRYSPIIALTANNITGSREMFLNAGFNDYLSKPIDIDALNHIMLYWIDPLKLRNKSSKTEAKKVSASSDTPQKSESPFSIEGIDIEDGMRNLLYNKDTFIEILQVFYHNGEQKAELMLKYFAEGDLKNLMIEFHGLKGTSKVIGANELSELSRQLELSCERAISGNNAAFDFINTRINDLIDRYKRLLNSIAQYAETNENEDNQPVINASCSEIIQTIEKTIKQIDAYELDPAEESLTHLTNIIMTDALNKRINEAYNELTKRFNYSGAVAILTDILDELSK